MELSMIRLDADTLTQDHFDQLFLLEQDCGLDPYPPEVLLTCVTDLETFACFDGEKMLGFITTHYSSRYLNGSVYIINLNVRRSARRQGIATSLLHHICQHYYPRHSKRMVSLDVGKSNVKALALYKKLGFRETGIPSRNGKTDVVMAIPLADLLQNTHTPRT